MPHFPSDHSAWARLIWEVASRFKVDPALISAIVQVESGGNADAIRYEKHYRWLVSFSHDGCSADTERNAQKTSWGLMQIMGAVARERGFSGPFLSQLCIPHVGLEWGTRHLRHLAGRGYTQHEVISAYNQGTPRRLQDGSFRNQPYVDKVLHELEDAKDVYHPI